MNDQLFLLANQNKIQQIRDLIRRGADVNYQDESGTTALMNAAKKGYTDLIVELLNQGANPNIQNNDNFTALFYSIFGENYSSVIELLNHGADVNLRGKYNITPLIAAADSCGYDIMKLLLENGADVNAEDNIGSTALLTIYHCENTIQIVGLLLDPQWGGVNINHMNEVGKSIWHVISWIQNQDFINYLIQQGADPNLRDANGDTPLFEAVSARNVVLIDSLITSGADVNHENREGKTPLYISISLGLVEPTLFLLSNDASLGSARVTSEMKDFMEYLSQKDISRKQKTKLKDMIFNYYIETEIGPLNRIIEAGYKYEIGFTPDERVEIFNKLNQWKDICSADINELPPMLLQYIAKFLRIKRFDKKNKKSLCEEIRSKLLEHLKKVEQLDYSNFEEELDYANMEPYVNKPPLYWYQYRKGERYGALDDPYLESKFFDPNDQRALDYISREQVWHKRDVTGNEIMHDFILRHILDPEDIQRSNEVYTARRGDRSANEIREDISDHDIINRLYTKSQIIDFIKVIRRNIPQSFFNSNKDSLITFLLSNRELIKQKIPEVLDDIREFRSKYQ